MGSSTRPGLVRRSPSDSQRRATHLCPSPGSASSACRSTVMPVLITTRREGPPDNTCVLRVSLNRPEVGNAFDEDVIAALTALARDASSRSSLRAIVLCGRRPRVLRRRGPGLDDEGGRLLAAGQPARLLARATSSSTPRHARPRERTPWRTARLSGLGTRTNIPFLPQAARLQRSGRAGCHTTRDRRDIAELTGLESVPPEALAAAALATAPTARGGRCRNGAG